MSTRVDVAVVAVTSEYGWRVVLEWDTERERCGPG